MPLKQIIGNARVVALGEATHGTREFFQMKHRILEFLVREMGFTTFGIEATCAESNRVNDYVHTGVGIPQCCSPTSTSGPGTPGRCWR